jgi:hypothetical protein
MSIQKLDISQAIYNVFRFVEQDSMEEHTFRHLLDETILAQHDSYTILLRLWQEHGYITILSSPGKPRYIALGPSYGRDYCNFM